MSRCFVRTALLQISDAWTTSLPNNCQVFPQKYLYKLTLPLSLKSKEKENT
jgi:hypothetical protein